jgi:general secretion pathway protein J
MKGASVSLSRRMGGFTLVEVLVAFTLLSAVMLALGAALRTMAQTEERVDRRLAEVDDMRVAAAFLQSTIGRVSARRAVTPSEAGKSLFLFAGEPQSLSWVGVMPARHGAGGRHYFRLAPESSAGSTSLVIRFAPWNGTAAFPDWSRAESRVLVPQLASLRFQYCDGNAQPPVCSDRWSVPDRMPGRVRIGVGDDRGAWPDLVIAARPLGGGERGGGGFTVGGSE